MRYDYDMLGNRIHQASMEAGERWMLNDVTGKPLYAWDSRDHQFRTGYDQLRRPIESFLREGAGPERLVGRTVYGETQANPEASNLRGQVVQLFDQAGVVTTDEYDFKGNLLRSQRQLARRLQDARWTGRPPCRWKRRSTPAAPATTRSTVRRNWPRRTTASSAPATTKPTCWSGSTANLRGDRRYATAFVTDIDYDAKGQRTLIDYGNGVTTTYDYDPLTFRLVHLLTRRDAIAFPDDCPAAVAARLARMRRAEPALHLRPGGQHHPHPRRCAADDLLPQQVASSRAPTTPTTPSTG